MKRITEAMIALFLFKKYANMPRWMEIGYSLINWGCLILILISLIQILNKAL